MENCFFPFLVGVNDFDVHCDPIVMIGYCNVIFSAMMQGKHICIRNIMVIILEKEILNGNIALLKTQLSAMNLFTFR